MPSSTEAGLRLLGRRRGDGAAAVAAAAADGGSLADLVDLVREQAGAGALSIWMEVEGRLAHVAGNATGAPPADALAQGAAASDAAGLAVPLRAGGRPVGLLWAPPPAPRAERLRPMADVLGLALAAMRAQEELDGARRERGELFDHAVRSAEREREEIAHVLHDGPLQVVTAMRLMADVARRAAAAGDGAQALELLERLEVQATQIAADLRVVTARLHPVVMEQLGLHVALGALAESIEADHGVPCAYEGPGPSWSPAPERDAALYAIAKEAAVAAARSGAAEARMRLHADGGRVALAVEHGPLAPSGDDDRRALELGEGLVRERAERIGADVRVERGPASGGIWIEVGERRVR